ncbi:hypothetical protein THAOC_31662, partial [Thalassiosira oceanica]
IEDRGREARGRRSASRGGSNSSKTMPSFRPKSPFKKGGAGVKNGVKNGIEDASAMSSTKSKKPVRNQRNGQTTTKSAGQPVDTRDPIKLSRDRSNMSREGSDRYSRPGESLELPNAEAIETMSKAEAYALASKLATHPAILSRQQSSSRSRRHGSGSGSSSSSSRPPAGDAKKQEALRQAREIAARRKKQRIVTPGMLASRPIERNSVMMRSSKATKDDESACDSATTEDTEVVENKKRANARRRRRLRSSGVGLMSESVASQRKHARVEFGVGDGILVDDAYIPSLDTLQSMGTWESAKEDDSTVGKSSVNQGNADIYSASRGIGVGDETRVSLHSMPEKIQAKNPQSEMDAKEEEVKPEVSRSSPKIESNAGKTQLRLAKKEDQAALTACGDMDKRVEVKSAGKSSGKAQSQAAKKEGDTSSLSEVDSAVRVQVYRVA